MSDTKIRIKTEELNSQKILVADPYYARLNNKGEIRFENKALGTGDKPKKGVDISIKFYDMSGGFLSDEPMSGFCKDIGTSLDIEAKGKFKCEVQNAGAFKFTVEADGYELYDPVIIVDVPSVSMNPATIFIVAAATVLAGALTFYLGTKKRS